MLIHAGHQSELRGRAQSCLHRSQCHSIGNKTQDTGHTQSQAHAEDANEAVCAWSAEKKRLKNTPAKPPANCCMVFLRHMRGYLIDKPHVWLDPDCKPGVVSNVSTDLPFGLPGQIDCCTHHSGPKSGVVIVAPGARLCREVKTGDKLCEVWRSA